MLPRSRRYGQRQIAMVAVMVTMVAPAVNLMSPGSASAGTTTDEVQAILADATSIREQVQLLGQSSLASYAYLGLLQQDADTLAATASQLADLANQSGVDSTDVQDLLPTLITGAQDVSTELMAANYSSESSSLPPDVQDLEGQALLLVAAPTASEDNTGVSSTGPEAYQPANKTQALGITEKLAGIAELEPLSDAEFSSSIPTVHPGGSGPSSPPAAYSINTVLHAEGEGNGGVTYTCGPSSTRNLIQTLTGVDYGEAQFASWENTNSNTGTAIGAIASTLNTHFGGWGSWTLYTPSSPANLVTATAEDTYIHGTDLVQNVRTQFLSFWNKTPARHYDLIYGYTHNGSYGEIYVGEEWDHPVNGGVVVFGPHRITALDDLDGIQNSPSHEIVV